LRKAKMVALALKAREPYLLPRNHKNCEDSNAGVEKLVRWMKEVIAQHVLLSKHVSVSISWLSCELTQLVRNARKF
jgi:hypothetical protein